LTTNNTQPARGTRDFLPGDVRRREYVIGVIKRVYELHGYEPLETPAFENIETLVGQYGDEGNKLIFKILKRGEQGSSGDADLALRYDLTVPLARVVAQYQNELPKFFKRYQIQPVWRADRPAKGRFREFYQCDVDAVGSTSPVVEADILGAVSEVLVRLGFDDFVIRLNHRRALAALLECAGVPGALHGDALVALDKLDKIGVDGVRQELTARGVDAAATLACLNFFSGLSSDDPQTHGPLDRLREFVRSHHEGPSTVTALDEIVRLSDGTAAHGRIRVDPSLARGLSYYTGAIMEIAVPDLAGSLGGGGRYDHLVGAFLGRDVPACGFSLGLERIIVVMTERDMFPAAVARAPVDVLVTLWNEESRADAIELASELRGRGLRVEVYPDTDKLGKQFKYASTRQIPCVAVIGDDERAKGEVAIKNLRTGDQHSVPRGDAAASVQSAIEHG
jgi:histidyl-tRNA synthetase